MATDYTPNVDDVAAPTSGHPPYRVFDEIRLLKERAKVLWGMRGQTSAVTYEVKASSLQGLLATNMESQKVVNVLNYHTGLEGGGGVFYWDSSRAKTEHNGGTVVDPGKAFPTDWNDQTQLTTWFTAGASGTGCWVRQYDGAVNVKWFGAKGDGVTDDTVAFLKALDIAATANTKNLQIQETPAFYKLQASVGESGLNFAPVANFKITTVGIPTLGFYGQGHGFRLIGGYSGTNISNITVDGLIVKGLNDNIFMGVEIRGIVRSRIANIEVRDIGSTASTSYGFYIAHGVSAVFENLRLSQNTYTHSRTPNYGLMVTNNDGDGLVGYYTADCTFINMIFEHPALGNGLYLHSGSGNTFLGGTFEACVEGLLVANGCNNNKFDSVWFEANSVRDMNIRGTGNSFYNCTSISASQENTVEIADANNTIFIGGYYRQINLQAISKNTNFYGVSLSNHSTIGITGSGSGFSKHSVYVDTALTVTGRVRDYINYLPTVSTIRFVQGVDLTSTLTSFNYTIDGNYVELNAVGTFTNAGTAGSAIILSLPEAVDTSESLRLYVSDKIPIGSVVGNAILKIAGTFHTCALRVNGASNLAFIISGGASLAGISPGITVANNDTFTIQCRYIYQ